MADEHKNVGQEARPGANIPFGDSDELGKLERFVERQVQDALALHKTEIDLEYRIKRYKELTERYRTLSSELAEVQRQREMLNLPPRLLRELKTK